MARSKPYSEDLRWTLVQMRCVAGLSLDEIVAQTGLKKRTVHRVFQPLDKTGMVLPDQQRSHPQTKLGDDEVKFIKCCIEHTPDIYLDELKLQLEDVAGVHVSTSTIWRTLKKAGFTMKKITKVALEQSEQRRLEYIARTGSRYEPNQLVFVDESSFDRRTSYRGYAWALKGQRAMRKCFFVRGKR